MRGADTSDEPFALELLHRYLATARPDHAFEVVTVDASNYADYRSRILDMQQRVYEPARQSPPAEFDALFQSDNPISILVLAADEIVAMSFAGPLQLFQHQRGVPQDPYRDDPSVAYMLDLTVAESYRGGLGAALKQATTVLAAARGVTAIHGRNRDRLAAGMWAINLSLGSYVTNYLEDDYPDDQPYRDCLYYRCPLQWERPPLDLGGGIEMPSGRRATESRFHPTAAAGHGQQTDAVQFRDAHVSQPAGTGRHDVSGCITPRLRQQWPVRVRRQNCQSAVAASATAEHAC